MPLFLERAPAKKVLTTKESIYVHSPSKDEFFLAKIKLFPIRFYDPDTRKWELPVTQLSNILKTFPDVIFTGEMQPDLKFGTIQEYLDYLATLTPDVDHKFKTKPDPHQVEWFNKMLHLDRVINGDKMGLGKTKEYLDVAEYRKTQGYKKILFICKSKHKHNMARQIKIHTDSKYLIVEGMNDLQTLRDFYTNEDIYYLIISYEMVAHYADILKIINKEVGFDGVLMDEFNKIKNWGNGRPRKDGKKHITIQVTNLVESLNPELLILGSGTPMTKRPTDLYAPLKLVGVEKRNHYLFQQDFCYFNSWGQYVGPKNKQKLHDLLNSAMIARPKEILQLEAPRVTYMPLRMTPKQEAFYVAARNQLREELKETKVLGASALALLIRLRQITTNPRLVDKDIVGIKEQVLEEMLEDLIDEGEEKAVVFSIFREETKLLKEQFKKYNPGYIDGMVTSLKATEEMERFLSDPACKLMIGSLGAAKESYDFTSAAYGIFLDESWTVTDNDQARDRLHRRGQDKTVFITKMYCQGTIDERVLDVLAQDASLIKEVVEGDKYAFSRDVIDYLLS